MDAVQNLQFSECDTLVVDRAPTNNVEFTIFDTIMEREKIDCLHFHPFLGGDTVARMLCRSKGRQYQEALAG